VKSRTERCLGGYHLAFLVAAGCTIAGIVVAYAILRAPVRRAEAVVVEHPAARESEPEGMLDAA